MLTLLQVTTYLNVELELSVVSPAMHLPLSAPVINRALAWNRNGRAVNHMQGIRSFPIKSYATLLAEKAMQLCRGSFVPELQVRFDFCESSSMGRFLENLEAPRITSRSLNVCEVSSQVNVYVRPPDSMLQLSR